MTVYVHTVVDIGVCDGPHLHIKYLGEMNIPRYLLFSTKIRDLYIRHKVRKNFYNNSSVIISRKLECDDSLRSSYNVISTSEFDIIINL